MKLSRHAHLAVSVMYSDTDILGSSFPLFASQTRIF
jgi:hypothetical protein